MGSVRQIANQSGFKNQIIYKHFNNGMTTLMGTGFFANVAAGAISGLVSGQYGRLAGLVLSGPMGQAGSVLFRPQDMLLDSVLGGTVAGIGFGIGRIGSP